MSVLNALVKLMAEPIARRLLVLQKRAKIMKRRTRFTLISAAGLNARLTIISYSKKILAQGKKNKKSRLNIFLGCPDAFSHVK